MRGRWGSPVFSRRPVGVGIARLLLRLLERQFFQLVLPRPLFQVGCAALERRGLLPCSAMVQDGRLGTPANRQISRAHCLGPIVPDVWKLGNRVRWRLDLSWLSEHGVVTLGA